MNRFLSSLLKFEVNSRRLLSLSLLGVRSLDERRDLGMFIALEGVEMCSSFEVDGIGLKKSNAQVHWKSKVHVLHQGRC